ncbi:MAG TPA: dicarboxylate/amino acid:cation symporter [Bacteroidales bacterium]|nr:dicarboxylate/amino acid:cation symporter [Bacteroidales bacterium]
MKKVALHWQILIALILAVIYGLLFPTHYVLDEQVVDKLEKKMAPSEVVATLREAQSDSSYTYGELVEVAREQLTPAAYEKYYPLLVRFSYTNPAIKAVSWMGDLFLRALRMIIIPLILSSLISGVTNIGSGSNLGRLSLKTMGYYVITSLLAILTGLLLVNLIQPGVGTEITLTQEVGDLVGKQKSFLDIIIEIVPDNIFRALADADMLAIIFFAILFGFFVMKVDEKPRQMLIGFFNAIFEVMMKIVMFVILFTPLGIFGIVAKVVADQNDLLGLISSMSLYMVTVVAGLLIHALITLPLLLRFVGRVRPFAHLRNMTTPLLTAFSTSSSGATLPLTMSAVEKKSGVSNKISSFTLPLGATINMDGTALYECVAAMFIAQAYGIELSLFNQLIIVATALLASIGAAAIPMAGLVMITVILTAVQLPLEGVGLILAVDRILDMFRTTVNVWSDSCGAVIIARSEQEQLAVDL